MPLTAYHRHTSRLVLVPEDPDAPLRAQRLRELGIGPEPLRACDEAARRLAEETGAPCAVVTLVDAAQQFFAGLHAPPGMVRGRTMAREYGFCPYVVARRRALVLDDVRAYPRFAGNPLVEAAGIRAYADAPLLDPSGIALGTLAAVDHTPRPWGREGLAAAKSGAARLTGQLLEQARDLGPG